MSEKMHRLFVYGTLMKGEAHHDQLSGARFLGQAHTRPEYDLVQVDYYPAMVRGGKLRIYGELYEVSGPVLERVDVLEGAPDEFQRELIVLDDGSEALCYLMGRERAQGGEPIPSGYFRMRTAPPKKQ